MIVNPSHGHFAQASEKIALLLEDFSSYSLILAGILLKEDTTIDEVLTYRQLPTQFKALIHAGFSEGKQLASRLAGDIDKFQNVFIDGRNSKLYQKHFSDGVNPVLIRDGFERRRNRDHPEIEFFSDLHATYKLEGMIGFGDFLVVGDGYTESGGPAYAIAIHLTFIDNDRDEEMHIHHFKSDRQDTPTDPAGKFAEALTKLIQTIDSSSSKFYESSALREFRQLHERRHFPGLGYVKKLSMNHHIKTIADYIRRSSSS